MSEDRKYHILVVEDDPGTLNLYKLSLQKVGYLVHVARNYREAIDAIHRDTFDIAIIDIELDPHDSENADGLRVVAHINKLENKPQSILATGFIDRVTPAWQESVYGVWEKSGSSETLLKKIEAALEMREELTPVKIKNSLNTIIRRMAREKLSLEQVLDLILIEMTALVKVKSANLSLVDDNRLKITATTAGKEQIGREFDVDNSVSGLAIRRQKTVYFPEIESDGLAQTLFKPSLGETKLRGSELAVPITIGLEPIAVINFESPQKHAFREGEIKLIEELASQVAIVINSARLQDQTNAIRRLSDISGEINSIIQEGETMVAGNIVDKMVEFMNCDKAAIFNYDAIDSKIDFMAHRGLSREYVLNLDPLAVSPRTLTIQSRQPVIVTDIANDERFISVRAISYKEGIRALIELPLQVRGKMIGSIVAYYRYPRVFEAEEITLAKLFADHVAIALNNALEYQDLISAKQRSKLATIGELSGDIVHRMNSPLAAIKANVGLIRAEFGKILENEKELKRLTGEIYRIADDGIKMVRQLRERARQDVLEPVDIRDIIARTLEDIEIPKTLRLENNIDSQNQPLIVRANLNLTKVFSNLITNAIDAMPQGGILRLDAKSINKNVEVTVEDTGIGIPDDFRDEIFNILSFFSKKRTDGGGHGLGLWYCRAFVEACGGELPPPDSRVGTGTVFTVRLPVWDEDRNIDTERKG